MSLYSKYRPKTFDEVIGQDHITTTLKNQIKTGKTHHAYLFCGIRGTGKTTLARILAKTVNCENPVDGNPCLECPTCKAIQDGTILNVIEIDAASNTGVDNVRDLRDDALYMPQSGKYKVYIIDETHMLSKAAFNALLKIIEEPPKHVLFILATTESQKIPETILSRCQCFNLKRIGKTTMKEKMKEYMDIEGVKIEDKALDYIVELSEGSMRDGLSILEQIICVRQGEEITLKDILDVLGNVDYDTFNSFTENLEKKDIKACIETISSIYDDGKDITNFVNLYLGYLRNLVLIATNTDISLLDMSLESANRIKEIATKFKLGELIYLLEEFQNCEKAMKYSSMPKLNLEMLIIRLCKEEEYVPASQAASQAPVKKAKPRVANMVKEVAPGDIDAYQGAWNALVDATNNMPTRVLLNQVVIVKLEENKVYMTADNPNSVQFVREHAQRLQDALPKCKGNVIEINIEEREKLEKAAEEAKKPKLDDANMEDLVNSINFDVNIDD